MFQIARKVVMFFSIYLPCLIGFTFIFMFLLPSEDSFRVSPITFMKTVSMMIGELEYEDTFGQKSVLINIVFFVFVVIIPIIINNLLIGLTVDNVSELMEDAQFKSIESKLYTIKQLEKSFVLAKVLRMLSFHIYSLSDIRHLLV